MESDASDTTERGEVGGEIITALIGTALGLAFFVGIFVLALSTCPGCTG